MDKGKEKGILKLEPRSRLSIDTKAELTPQAQGPYEVGPASPQPSVDRLSVTWADPGSMASSGLNEVKFSPSAGEFSDDEDYSASLSAVLRQRRASVRRSRKGRSRRPSSPFLAEEVRRRSSVFTTSSGDTAISMEEIQSAVVTQEQIFENIHIHKEVLSYVKQEPFEMRKKLKIVHQAKGYIKRHEGQLQQRLAQSKSTKDIYARFSILLNSKWQQLKREAANTSNLLIPWELRIKEIESHFGSVVASYFTFLRWLFWVNLVIGFILLVFVIVPEYLTADPKQDGQRKVVQDTENATNLLTLWEFEGILKYSPIFYGYYSNIERPQYAMPLAYFLTGLAVYIYSFVAILRKMAENSRMSKLSEKEDECIFSWKLFTGWDFMIGNAETAHNRIASVILGFKEALLEEAEKKKNLRNWRIISLRGVVNICVIVLLAVSAYAVVTVVSRSDDSPKARSWWRENETTIVVTLISITFPVLFELLGLFEHYHPRKQLRLQLARIMLLNLLNLYSLIFALFTKIGGMSIDLNALKPINDSIELNISSSIIDPMLHLPTSCYEEMVACEICKDMFSVQMTSPVTENIPDTGTVVTVHPYNNTSENLKIIRKQELNKNYTLFVDHQPEAENLIQTTRRSLMQEQLERLRNIASITNTTQESDDPTLEVYDEYFELQNINNTLSNNESESNSFRDYVYNPDFTDNILNNEDNNINTIKETTTNINDYTSNTESFTDQTIDQNSTSSEIKHDWTASSDTISDLFYNNTTNYDWLNNSETMEEPTTTDRYTESSSYKSLTNLHKTTFNDYTSKDIDMHEFTLTEISPTPDLSKTYLEKETPMLDYDSSTNTDSTTLSEMSNCPKYLNCSLNCNDQNITQVFVIENCKIVTKICYRTTCKYKDQVNENKTHEIKDIVYLDSHNRKMYNLTDETKKKLEKLCWETLFGQELVKLTMMDLVFVLLGTLFMDFFRALFVRYMNRCWCWDLEKKFPEYGDFKIAENILHLINNQGMVWMGMFFSPGLVVLNVVKLMVMMYLRSWAVMTCNVPHEVVFRVSKSNNFYLALLLTMLFLCVLPVGYAIVWIKPSWHCGPFSEHQKIYYILTNNIYKILPKSLNFPMEYITSPAIVIPLLVLLILIIYYLISLTNSLREANNDLKAQLRRERTEERRKMFKLADTRVRAGSGAVDNTPFSRWKKALPSLPLRSIDSDENKTITGDGTMEPQKVIKKKGGIFAKIVGMAVDKKTDIDIMPVNDNNILSPVSKNDNDDSDTDFHESLPKEVLTIKDIVFKSTPIKKKNSVEFKTDDIEKSKVKTEDKGLKVKLETIDDRTEKKAILEKQKVDQPVHDKHLKSKPATSSSEVFFIEHGSKVDKKLGRKQTSESSNQSRQSDSIGSVIPVITISATESDEELLQSKNDSKDKTYQKKDTDEDTISDCLEKINKNSSDIKSLRRQSSVESINEQKLPKEMKPEDGHKYQYSL
ncbi:transmembrane channel-like protein isoform X2 [Plodia interpunctella]|uniref:transmembrane channel-like protein isoform X2 n=1 Tax=Plodia interpunctella TaxID=58824 RepID=UPI0023686F36|nr:transmembrane channel-like protein isoform X2 [Plodia interpunctella]